MNIFVYYWGQKGGGAKYSEAIAKELIKQRSLNVYLSFSRDSDGFKNIERLTDRSLHIKTARSRVSLFIRTLLLPILIARIIMFLRTNKIKYVYTPMAHPWSLFLIPALKLFKIEHILTVHDATPHPGDKEYLQKINRYIIEKSDHLITLSSHVKQELIKNYDIDSDIFVSVHGVLSYDFINTRPKDFVHSKFKIIFFGRILKYKGLQHLLGVQQALEKRHSDIFLEVYGSGDLSSYEDSIMKIKNIKIDNRWIDDAEVYEVFDTPAIMILPYTEASQSGVVPIALDCGIPCICTKVGALDEQIIDDETGFVIRNDDDLVENITGCVERLYRDRGLCDQLSKNAESYTRNNLQWDIIATKLTTFFQSL